MTFNGASFYSFLLLKRKEGPFLRAVKFLSCLEFDHTKEYDFFLQFVTPSALSQKFFIESEPNFDKAKGPKRWINSGEEFLRQSTRHLSIKIYKR
ncbi:unknown protein [Simkania negevensis Z]|uniref:Uncharacterized protein n=1 Tax=Simkania negevensis (strain ATCC VR-1471 / DSM 27360 / Z) TaxID=331113 RepID=F8L700_SIMNZ|nr:unknown protein [Simkania negevensis Z]